MQAKREGNPARGRKIGQFARVFWPILVPLAFGLYLFFAARSELLGELERLTAAQSDNSTWNVSQLEVDYLTLLTAVDQVIQAEAGEVQAAVSEARLRYDILYSRVTLLKSSDRFTVFSDDDRIVAGLDRFGEVVLGFEDSFDLDADAFAQKAPEVGQALREQRPQLRRFVMATLESLAVRADAQRVQLRNLLLSFTGISIAALAILTSISSALVVANSVARRRAAAQERLSSNLGTTIEASPFAVMTATQSGIIDQFNSAAEEMFRIPKQAALGRRISDLGFFPASHAAEFLSPEKVFFHAARRSVIPQRAICSRADGATFVSETVFAFDDDAGQLPVVIIFVRDISEQETREAALATAVTRARESERAKSRFLAVMSHEMRSPLSSAIAALELLGGTRGLNGKQKEYLGIVQSGTAAALEQVDDVLELAHLDGGSRKEETTLLDPREYLPGIEKSFRPLAERRGNALSLRLSGFSGERIRTRRRLLTRVITNVLGNAIKFTRNGSVTVDIALMPTLKGQGILAIDIADTGTGIPGDKIETVFEDFEVLDDGQDREMSGTGLGLGIVRRAVAALEGKVSVTSEPSMGTVFRLWIPVGVEEAGEEAPAVAHRPRLIAPEEEMSGPARTVLIVDDVEANRVVLREMVLRLGHRPLLAESGPAAIDVCLSEVPDLVLMDCSMPGMSGMEASRKLAARMGSGTPRVVGLTANIMQNRGGAEEGDRFTSLELKPLQLARLRELIEDAGGEAPAPAGPERDPALFDMFEVREMIGAPQFDILAASLAEEIETLLVELASPTPPGPDFVHRAAGACASLGLSSIHVVLKDCEDAMRSGGGAGLSEIVCRLSGEWRRLRPAVLGEAA